MLLASILLFNLADLSLTVTNLRGIGLAEANPVARAVMRLGGVEGLIVFKVALVLLGLGILYRLRRDVRAEVCSWVMMAIMAALMVQWRVYGREMVSVAPSILDNPPVETWVAPPTPQRPFPLALERDS